MVCFLLHFPWPHGRWALPITLSCGARTFLLSKTEGPNRFLCFRPAAIQSTPVSLKGFYARESNPFNAASWRLVKPSLPGTSASKLIIDGSAHTRLIEAPLRCNEVFGRGITTDSVDHAVRR